MGTSFERLGKYIILHPILIFRSRINPTAQVTSTGQLNTILTFYEISDPAVPSPLSGIPTPLLKKAIASLAKTGRAQLIGIAEGEGVRFFAGR